VGAESTVEKDDGKGPTSCVIKRLVRWKRRVKLSLVVVRGGEGGKGKTWCGKGRRQLRKAGKTAFCVRLKNKRLT